MNELAHVIPEASLVVAASIALLADASAGKRCQAIGFYCALIGGVVVLAQLAFLAPAEPVVAFGGTFRIDALATVLKVLILALVLLSFLYAREYFSKRGTPHPEHYPLALFATSGMLLLVSASNLLTVYLGLELLSLSLYAMVALQRDSAQASEAAMKYFVLGALASGMLLYGMSILFGISGTLDLTQLLVKVSMSETNQGLVLFGLVFLLVGICFKLGVAPFHMWVPDVYQGAATPVTQFIGTAPKLAAFAMALRLLADGLSAVSTQWSAMLAILAVLSMGVGNVLAIAQTNLKRMLAYSTVAHMGYLLLGLIAAGAAGYAASMFYVTVYAVMSMGAFGAIILLSTAQSESDQLSDLAGLAKRSPWLAFLMLILMFSMAGVPPFAGFWAKWFVLKEVVATGHVLLAAIAVLFSLVGAFYYLRVIKIMYFDEPAERDANVGRELRLLFSVNGLLVLALGLAPGGLMALCLNATRGYLPFH